ncbi:hypothetical protein MHYP_G00295450 [Metynnis hypsauchen]
MAGEEEMRCDEDRVEQGRSHRLTEKGLKERLQRLIALRRQVRSEAQNVKNMMESDFARSQNEFKSLNNEVGNLLSEDEKMLDHDNWFEPKMALIKHFMKTTKRWVADEHESTVKETVQLEEHNVMDEQQEAVLPSGTVSQIEVHIAAKERSCGSHASRVWRELLLKTSPVWRWSLEDLCPYLVSVFSGWAGSPGCCVSFRNYPAVTCSSSFPPFIAEKRFNQRGFSAGTFALADYTFRFCYMESLQGVRLGVLIVLLQVLSSGFAESPPCSPGFESDLFIFTVHREHLHRGRRLGRVVFDDCSGRTRTVFNSADKRFQVDSDGMVKLKRQVSLHEGHRKFSVSAWDSKGNKHTTFVRVEHEPKTHHHDHVEDTEAVSPPQSLSSPVPVIEFPKSSRGLRGRTKRWVIPPVRIPENDRGPFPKEIVQIKSSFAKEAKMVYSISGEGADQDPKGLFTINRISGFLSVTRPLDREAKDKYVLQAHAFATDGDEKEDPAEIIVEVIDMNDNTPVFTQNPFLGTVPEASEMGFEFMTVNATDADEPNTDNADIRYSILSQNPQEPDPAMFAINPVTGAIRVNAAGLDREKYPQYTLKIAAGDSKGEGRVGTGTAVITVTDSNDNAPQFEKTSYNVSVPENKVGAVVVKMPVTDGDEPQSPAWTAKFRIINGNSGGFFAVNTGPNKQEGIITTVKPLDFEQNNKFTLLVVAENDIPFAKPLATSTATVIVNVLDVNEAPVFDPEQKNISVPEDMAVGSVLTVYTATDPDTARTQKVTYRVGRDPAGWVSVDGETGLVKVRSPMDRESAILIDGIYKVLILAMDDDPTPATGTGTLAIELKDVNDNIPFIEERTISMCNKESAPALLSVIDYDGPGFAAPYRVELQGDSKNNWTAMMNDTKTGIILRLKVPLEHGEYNVVMRVYDTLALYQDNTVHATVCDCTGDNVQCIGKTVADFGLPAILGILGAIMALLVLLLLLLLFARRKSSVKKEPLLADDDLRDNVYYYDEEGGGEDDQDFDLSVLHRGLDNRPDVFRNDVAPTFMPAPQYRPRPANPEEIGTFIDDNLKAADNDPTAPPYDSLLVFDYEGGGSDAGSLSSLNSSSSGDQDYNCLANYKVRDLTCRESTQRARWQRGARTAPTSAISAPEQSDDIKQLLSGIKSEVSALRAEILGELRSSISSLKSSLHALERNLEDTGNSLTEVDSRVTTLENTCSALVKENVTIRAKLDDLENRARRNNIQVIGVPEGLEGPRPTSFMESLLLDVFGSDSFTKPPAIDCAHRSLAPMPKQHKPPRPMIVRLHHFQTRERIFQLAREKGQLQFQGNGIHIYPDFSADVARRRAAFTAIKPHLREAGVEYGLLFPARLESTLTGSSTSLNCLNRSVFLQGLSLSPDASVQ